MNKSFLYTWWDAQGTVQDLIETWAPTDCRSEKDYEDSLYRYLHSQLSDIQITQQYARGRNRVDLRVGERVVIELKCDLNSTAEYQRLLGQVVEMKDWPEYIFVLFAGDTDPYFPKALQMQVKDWHHTYLHDQKVSVITKLP